MGDVFSYSLVGRLIFILIKILVFLIAKDFYKFFVGKYDAYLWVGVIFVVAWIDSYFNIIVYEKGGRKQLIERAWKQKSRFKNRLILGCELLLSDKTFLSRAEKSGLAPIAGVSPFWLLCFCHKTINHGQK